MTGVFSILYVDRHMTEIDGDYVAKNSLYWRPVISSIFGTIVGNIFEKKVQNLSLKIGNFQ